MTADVAFVTGATGFIGRYLVVALLERGWKVFALTRAGGVLSARKRLMHFLEAAYGGALPDKMQENLEAVKGDLVIPDLGVSRDLRSRLAAEVGEVFHCGGDIRFQPKDRAAYRAVHLSGPMNVLCTVCTGGKSRFHHVSTAYVAGKRNGTAYENEADVGQPFRNSYERIKLKAEQAVRRECERLDVPFTILRPSIVVADPDSPSSNWSDPISTRFETFVRLFRLHEGRRRSCRPPHRIRGSGKSCLSMVPVTYVVGAMLEIAASKRQPARTYHLVDPAPPRNFEVLDHFAKVFGVSGFEPFEHRNLPMEEMTLFERKLDNLLRPYQDYFFEMPVFDDTNTRQLLDGRVGRHFATALRLLDRAAAREP